MAAILAADVVGSCRLIGIDEEGTLAQLKALRKTLFDPKIAQHHGRIVKNTGDGALVEFASVVDAVRCADDVQRGVAEQNTDVPQDKRIEFRVGIHLGDIIIADDDIFGDGVNIAVRLEEIAEPGGICISDDAHRQVRGKVEGTFEDMGSQNLKNIAEPMRVWRIPKDSVSASGMPAYPYSGYAALPLPDGPSIAILPFQNMSGDPDQDYFADGMVDEITTALSRFKSLFVIARNSSFTYKSKPIDIKQVGRELGVRYVLEGSVRKAAGKIRIIGQLIDAATGMHLWADRFEGDLSDIFALQDRMTESIVSAIAPKMFRAEIDLAARRSNDLSAYDLCLRANSHLYSWTRGGSAEALRLASRALEIDPRYGYAATLAGSCHLSNVFQGWAADPKSELAEGLRLLRLALSIDGNDHDALSILGCATAFFFIEYDTAREMVDRAIALNPNAAFAWEMRGWTYQRAGEPEEAIRSFDRAIRLSPFDPWLFARFTGIGIAYIGVGRFDKAVAAAKNALQKNQKYGAAYQCLAAALAHLGRHAEARKAATQILEIEPHFRISEWVACTGQWQAQMFIDGLRKAGLPD
ncbi:adenylate/guanylate cyclase domain-containing protein [Bradyrhizobium valentinum]|uniref:adenylate/guanylate cyclase domain-containing protein n=1 Tax=Bradyrhizobium valentinum TaxID=1518501 RepID=UPI001FD9F1D3|nr:adenylate/guanylate cyclase domain-containing protein [Bradyrhizobium valentinum]